MYVDEDKAVELLKSDDIVALPTETVYGLAARFDSPLALKKIFQIKKRPFFDPLIVHISQLNQIKKLSTKTTPVEEFLMAAFWPGPLTFILPKQETVDTLITAGLDTIAVRMPKNEVFLKIIERTAPLAAPSANMFGHTSPTLAEHVEMEFKSALSIFDGGPCAVGIESSVIQVIEEEQQIILQVLRPGMISPLELSTALKNYSPKKVDIRYGATQASPGHVQNHYQPQRPLVVAKNKSTWSPAIHQLISQKLKTLESLKPVFLSYSDQDPTLVARTLYSDFLRLSKETSSYIYLTVNDEFNSEMWRGLRDRIEKASSFSITENDGHFFIQNKLENF